jgi:hypothetical protein
MDLDAIVETIFNMSGPELEHVKDAVGNRRERLAQRAPSSSAGAAATASRRWSITTNHHAHNCQKVQNYPSYASAPC